MSQLYEKFKHWGETGNIMFYSDPHFGDIDLAKYIEGGRPSDEEQIKSINSRVGRKDTLVILGDVGDIECVKKLKGYKVLIMGNHDGGMTKFMEVFDEVYEGPVFIGKKILLSHERIEMDFGLNIHGHIHDKATLAIRKNLSGSITVNVCSDMIDYTPISLKALVRFGYLRDVKSIHRITIEKAEKGEYQR